MPTPYYTDNAFLPCCPTGSSPSVPQLATPVLSFSEITDTSFTINWLDVPNAEEYELEVYGNSGYTGSPLASGFITDPNISINITGRSPGVTYYVRVKATTTDPAYAPSDWGLGNQATTGGVTTYAYRIGYEPNGNDPFVNGSTAPAGVTYPVAFEGTINSIGAAITLLQSAAGFINLADSYIVVEMVTAITNRTLVANGGLGPYTIPSQEFGRSATAAGKKWIVSNNPWALSLTDNLSFTV